MRMRTNVLPPRSTKSHRNGSRSHNVRQVFAASHSVRQITGAACHFLGTSMTHSSFRAWVSHGGVRSGVPLVGGSNPSWDFFPPFSLSFLSPPPQVQSLPRLLFFFLLTIRFDFPPSLQVRHTRVSVFLQDVECASEETIAVAPAKFRARGSLVRPAYDRSLCPFFSGTQVRFCGELFFFSLLDFKSWHGFNP